MTRTVLVPVTTHDGDIKTTYRRDTGETLLSIRLDFPVGAAELVTFPPRASRRGG